MKLTNAAKKLNTNAEFTSQDFGIGDISIVIEILRNKMYRHKVRTLVQEYISNGRDAMREAGTPGPIEITAPSTFNPVFKVRDFGLGISQDRMSNVFIKYAASTKRDSNTQTGGFGIGAKSAWSYTDSFSIVTYIDGVQRTYVAHIGANNNGRLDYMGECKTSEANGTEIQVPVTPKDVAEFRNAIQRATFFWDKSERPVIKGISNAEMRERVTGKLHNNLEITDYNKMPDFIIGSYSGSKMILAIDGIPYVINGELVEKCAGLKSLYELVNGLMVIHLKNGDVGVAANREEVDDSKHTVDSLNAIGHSLYKLMNGKVKSEFAKCKNTFQHLATYMSLKGEFHLRNYQKYGEYQVDDNGFIESNLFSLAKIDICSLGIANDGFESVHKDDFNRSSGRRRYSRQGRLSSQQFDHLFFADGTESAIQMNYRIREYLKTNGTVLVFQKGPSLAKDGTPLDNTNALETLKADLGLKDLKTISFTKPPKAERAKIVREKQKVCLHKLASYRRDTVFTNSAENTQKWLYIEMDGHSVGLDKTEVRELSEYLEASTKYKVCAIAKSAVKMIANDKNFVALEDFLKDYKATSTDIAALKAELSKNTDMVNKLARVKGIKDKFLNSMLSEYETHKSKHGFVPKLLKSKIGKIDEVEEFKDNDKKLWDELKTRYPLLSQLYWTGKIETDEVAHYINAK